MIWLVFLQIIVALFEFPGSVYLHILVGFVIVAIAHYHQARIKRMAVPDRIRRIVRSTANLASAQFFLGIYTFLALDLQWPLPVPQVVVLLHLVVALAIFSQASSTATAYDMWEEREFERVAEVQG
jgi:heme A synthase